MKFSVVFKVCGNSGAYAINKPSIAVGMRAAEIAIARFPKAGLDIAHVEADVDEFKLAEVDVFLTLEQARNVPHAYASNVIEVSVPAEILNQYVDLEFMIDENKDGEDVAVPYWGLNTEALLNEWKEAGYPLNWDPTELSDEDDVSPPYRGDQPNHVPDGMIEGWLDSLLSRSGSPTFRYEVVVRMIRHMVDSFGADCTRKALDLVERNNHKEAA